MIPWSLWTVFFERRPVEFSVADQSLQPQLGSPPQPTCIYGDRNSEYTCNIVQYFIQRRLYGELLKTIVQLICTMMRQIHMYNYHTLGSVFHRTLLCSYTVGCIFGCMRLLEYMWFVLFVAVFLFEVWLHHSRNLFLYFAHHSISTDADVHSSLKVPNKQSLG
jgi:hypothetical protein